METEALSFPSPDGRYGFRIWSWEARMSHWIECGTLVETSGERRVFGFTDSNWSLDKAEWRSPSVVAMTVRKYPGNHTPADFVVALDCESRMATVENLDIPPCSWFELEDKLDAHVRKHPRRWLPG